MKNILIVEDELKLRNELSVFLTNNGYNVLVIDYFDNCINEIKKIDYDLMLLDINLPNISGEFICKEIRRESDIPIIMITSKNNELDEIISINYGADDYVVKPFNVQVLLARINRLLNKNNNLNIIKYMDFYLDTSKSCIIKDSICYDLSKNEFKILYYLVKNKNNIVSRDELIDYLWDNNEFVDDNTLTVNINRLRSKLLELGYDNVIITRRGQGYIVL